MDYFYFVDTPEAQEQTRAGEWRLQSLSNVRLDQDGELIVDATWHNSSDEAPQYLIPILESFGPIDCDGMLIEWVENAIRRKKDNEEKKECDKVLQSLRVDSEKQYREGQIVVVERTTKKSVFEKYICRVHSQNETASHWPWETPQYDLRIIDPFDGDGKVNASESDMYTLEDDHSDADLSRLSREAQFQNEKNEKERYKQLWDGNVERVLFIVEQSILEVLRENNANVRKSVKLPVSKTFFVEVMRDSVLNFEYMRKKYFAMPSVRELKEFLGVPDDEAFLRKIEKSDVDVRSGRRSTTLDVVLAPTKLELSWDADSCDFKVSMMVDSLRRRRRRN